MTKNVQSNVVNNREKRLFRLDRTYETIIKANSTLTAFLILNILFPLSLKRKEQCAAEENES